MKRRIFAITIVLALVFTMGLSAQTPPPRPGASAPAPSKGPTPPPVPSGVRVATISHDSANIQWNSAGQGITYKVLYNTSNNSNNARSVTANSTSIDITGLSGNTNYWVWVASVQNNLESGLTAAVTFRTTVAPPPTVTNVRSGNIRDDRVTVSWNNAGQGISYLVYYNSQNNPDTGFYTTTNATSFELTGLMDNATYYVWVVAVRDGWEGPYSQVLQIRTAAAPQDKRDRRRR